MEHGGNLVGTWEHGGNMAGTRRDGTGQTDDHRVSNTTLRPKFKCQNKMKMGRRFWARTVKLVYDSSAQI